MSWIDRGSGRSSCRPHISATSMRPEAGTRYRVQLDIGCLQRVSSAVTLEVHETEPPEARVVSPNGGEVFLLEQGATARGLLQRCRDDRGAGGLTLVRHLPWDQASLTVQAADTAGDGGRPTHLLFGHEALAVGREPLVLGTQAADGERWLDLRADMPGVSRRHCAVSEQNGRCVVTDYSRYGTFLNGHRIDGTAVLQPGDVLRIGTPGFELRLISAEATDGA